MATNDHNPLQHTAAEPFARRGVMAAVMRAHASARRAENTAAQSGPKLIPHTSQPNAPHHRRTCRSEAAC
eukprot:6695201-Alexandrium_andersonii.AAC.1